MTNIYEQLKPAIQEQLNKSSEKYESVTTIKYTLMSKTMWSDLKISTIKDLILFTDINKSDLDGYVQDYFNYGVDWDDVSKEEQIHRYWDERDDDVN